MGPLVQFLCVSLSLALSHATPVDKYPFYLSTGNSQQYRSQDSTGNYEFGYNEGHSSGGTFRKETSDAFGNKYGSYGLRDADGRYRVVNYVADANGFRASVQTNEPGVAPDDPASTTINKVVVPVVKQEPVAIFTKTVPAPVIQQEPVTVVKQEPISVFTKTVPQPPPVIKQEPVSVFTKTVPPPPPVIKQEPVSVFTTVPVSKSVPVPVSKGFAFPTATNSLLYSSDVHHSASPDYPLLYQAPYQVSYQAPVGYYKGTPFVGYNTYKGTPFAGYSPYKGTPFARYGYYGYP